MAAQKCVSCDAFISVRGAVDCPKCGARLPSDQVAASSAAQPPRGTSQFLIGAMAFAILLAVLFAFSGGGGTDSRAREAEMTILGEGFVKAHLKDPSGAQFRNQFISTEGAPCGEVNAKNSFGGYTGFKRYLAASKELAAVDGETMDSGEFEKIWRQFCRKP